MRETIDTTATRQFGQDHMTTISALLGCLAFVAVGLWALLAAPHFPSPGKLIFGGTLGVIGFGGFAAVGVARLIAWHRPLIIISPYGVRDARNTPDLVPWSSVVAIGEYRSGSGLRSIKLTLDPTAEAKVRRYPVVRLLRSLSPGLRSGEFISAHGTSVPYDELRDLVGAYARHHAPHNGAGGTA